MVSELRMADVAYTDTLHSECGYKSKKMLNRAWKGLNNDKHLKL